MTRQVCKKQTHNVCYRPFMSVLRQSVTERCISLKTNGVRERWIYYYHIPPLVCDGAVYLYRSAKTSAQQQQNKQSEYDPP